MAGGNGFAEKDQEGPGEGGGARAQGPDELQWAEEASLRYVRTVQPELLDGVDAVQARRVVIDEHGMAHTRLTQSFRGVPVWGGEAIVHLNTDGSFEAMTDGLVRHIDVDMHPSLSDFEAVGRALAHHGKSTLVKGAPQADLWVFRKDGVDHLAYRVQVEQFEADEPASPVVFMDAHSGEVIHGYDNVRYAAARNGSSSSPRPDIHGPPEGVGLSGVATLEGVLDVAALSEEAGSFYPILPDPYEPALVGKDCRIETLKNGGWVTTRWPSGSIMIGTIASTASCSAGWGCKVDSTYYCQTTTQKICQKVEVPRITFNANHGTGLPGVPWRTGEQGPTSDGVVNMAHDNAAWVYAFFYSQYGRLSYDDAGSIIKSSVHYSTNHVNAYWNGVQLVLGDGDGVSSSALVVLDVIAHELAHGVTGVESQLINSGESGALAEAISDMFAATIEAYRDRAVSARTWKIGEEFWTPGVTGDALRYMNDPALAGDYDYYPTRYQGSANNGGVNWNSGIANLAFYLMVSGGQHPRGKTTNVVPALAADPILSLSMAAGIFYRANLAYLLPSSTFAEARVATRQAALDLFGASAASTVDAAWDAVGVMPPRVWAPLATQTNLSGAAGSQINFAYVTPAYAKAMKFEMSGGTGDADLYVKFGSAPTTQSYHCRPNLAGNVETCEIDPSQQGTYYVMLRGYSSYSGVTLKVSSGQ